MPPIYIDFDDVICESTRSFIKILKREYGRTVYMEEITSFGFQEAFGLSNDEFKDFFHLIHQPEEVIRYLPFEGAITAIRNLSGKGYEINIVTGRLTSTYEVSLAWLAQYDVPYDDFIMVDKYGRPGTDMTIAVTMEELSTMKFTLAIEDSLEMALHLSGEMRTPVVLLDRPWNRSEKINDNVNRCSGWEQILGLIK